MFIEHDMYRICLINSKLEISLLATDKICTSSVNYTIQILLLLILSKIMKIIFVFTSLINIRKTEF